MTAQSDRLVGLTGNLGMKAPCRVATTANITLNGLQTIDGVALAEDDRVLVKSQTTASENGVYNASTGVWTRAADWDGTGDIVHGTCVAAAQGTLYAGSIFQLTTANPITIGTTSLTFVDQFSAEYVAFTPTGGLAATTVQAAIAELDTEKAPLASPALTGNPTAPTPAASDNDTSIATTAFVQGELYAANVDNTPAGSIAAVTVQAALNELDTEKEPRFPAGTAMVFFQAAAPAGWAQVITQNDKALRVVSGAGGGVGGSHALSTPPSTAHVHSGPSHTHGIGAHTHSIASDAAAHTHGLPLGHDAGGLGAQDFAWNSAQTSGTFSADQRAGGAAIGGSSTRQRLITDSASGTHDHGTATGSSAGTTDAGGTADTGSNGPTAFSPQYIDVIVCTRNA